MGEISGIIPDIMAAVPMPMALPHRDSRPGPFLPSRRLLWDVKVTFGDSRYQGAQWVRERQSGAVASRALGVWTDYLHIEQMYSKMAKIATYSKRMRHRQRYNHVLYAWYHS